MPIVLGRLLRGRFLAGLHRSWAGVLSSFRLGCPETPKHVQFKKHLEVEFRTEILALAEMYIIVAE
jgi:hypothetical protein